MQKIRKIVVACDFSEYMPRIIEFAAELAADLDADLILTNVINQRDVDTIRRVERDYPVVSVEKYVQDLKEDRSHQMDKWIEKSSGINLRVKKVFKVGVPFQEILKVIQEQGGDMLVMGTKGRSNLSEVLFGSTAEKMFRRCPIPLVSLRLDKYH